MVIPFVFYLLYKSTVSMSEFYDFEFDDEECVVLFSMARELKKLFEHSPLINSDTDTDTDSASINSDTDSAEALRLLAARSY